MIYLVLMDCPQDGGITTVAAFSSSSDAKQYTDDLNTTMAKTSPWLDLKHVEQWQCFYRVEEVPYYTSLAEVKA